MEEILKALEGNTSLPMRHRFGRIVVGGVAGFIATELSQKLYVMFYEYMQKRKTTT